MLFQRALVPTHFDISYQPCLTLCMELNEPAEKRYLLPDLKIILSKSAVYADLELISLL